MRRFSPVWPLVAAATTLWAVIATFLWLRETPVSPPAAQEPSTEPTTSTPSDPEPAWQLIPASYSDLPGWNSDDLVDALPALKQSCQTLLKWPADRALSSSWAGTAGEWSEFCRTLMNSSGTHLRDLLADLLTPIEVIDPQGDGLFTGYYEPTLQGSRTPSQRYRWPLYRPPPELVELDLGQFRGRLEGEKILGHVRDQTFEPYPERAELDAGYLRDRGLELVWVDDPVDAFFLHIQGSGRVELDDNSTMRVGYAGQNGRAYFAIGRELVRRGVLTMEEVSLQSIRAWLKDNPDETSAVLHTNPSYIFFRQLDGPGPLGSLGVPLTTHRSLAVDADVVPLGAPVWVATQAPLPEGGERDLQMLFLAQDTGGAIRGGQRGDVFWGPGADAAEIAGRMKHPGRMWALVPHAVATRLGSDSTSPSR